MLLINAMGGVSITRNGERLDSRLSDKAIALIFLLLSRDGQKVGKSKLIFYLWGDSDEAASRSNLRYNLWSIKKVIPAGDNGEELILSDRNHLFINPHYPFQSDIVSLKQFGTGNTSDIKTDELHRLHGLFRGEYMEGFYIKGCVEYSDTILLERSECHKLQTSVLEQLYYSYERIGEHEKCAEFLTELLHIDPFREKYALMMMENCICLRQPAQAATYYKTFEGKLRQNLNISPSVELKNLYSKLCRQNPVPAAGEKKESLDKRKINTFCINEVDYFWMSECIFQMLEIFGEECIEGLDKNYVEDLAAIQGRLIKKSGTDSIGHHVPAVRILFAFYHFISKCVKNEPLEIIVKDFECMDSASAAFFKYIDVKPIKNLVLTYSGRL